MPIYEYKCSECGLDIEEIQSIKAEPLKRCPSCGKDTLKKLISRVGFKFVGSGFYTNDYKNKEQLNKSVRVAKEQLSSKRDNETVRDLCGKVAENFNKVNESSKKPDPSVVSSSKVRKIA